VILFPNQRGYFGASANFIRHAEQRQAENVKSRFAQKFGRRQGFE
jgi:hypothetical protein